MIVEAEWFGLSTLHPLCSALIHTAALARWGKAAYKLLNRFNGFPNRFSEL
jgi:hypothetical protein